MSQVRRTGYDDVVAVKRGGDSVAQVSARRSRSPTVDESMREIETLRSMNAHLIQQLAAMKQREEHAQRLADRDGLTGLYNRRRMVELLDSVLHGASEQGHKVGLLFIDLDGFKGINDDFGHAAGDKLLVTVASRIAARARNGDLVCRYGGDEFVVILPQVVDRESADVVADSIRARVGLPYQIDGFDVEMSAAIGVSIYPEETCQAGELLRLADESMYRAKAAASRGPAMARCAVTPARRRDDKAKRILVR